MTPSEENGGEIQADGNEDAPVSANASSKRVLKNVIVGYLTLFVTTLIGFFTTPLLIRFLGAEKFGLWTMLLSILGYVGMVEVGTYTTVAKRVAECLAVRDMARLSRVLSTASIMYVAMSVIVLLAVTILYAFLPRLYPHLTPEDTEVARAGLLILGVMQCVSFLFAIQSAILSGSGRLDIANRTSTGINIAQALANVFLVWRGYGIPALCLSGLISATLAGVLMRRQARRNLPGIQAHRSHASAAMARELLKYGFRFSLMSIAGALSFSSDVLILGFFMPVAAIAQYVIATKLIGFISILTIKPMNGVAPAFTHMEATGDREGQFRLLTSSGFASMLIGLPFAIAFCALGDRIIAAWVGTGFSASYPVLIVQAFWIMLITPGGNCVNLMTATEKNLFLVRAYLVTAVCNVLLSIWLTARIGLIGPALSSLIAVAVLEFAILPFVTCRLFGFSLKAFWYRLLSPLALPALIGIAVAAALRFLPLAHNRLVAAAMLISVVGTCWGTWFFFVLQKEQRKQYEQVVLLRLRRAG